MMRTEEELIGILDDPERGVKDRIAAAADLLELCRRDEAARDRYLMRFVTFLADDSPAMRGWGILGVVLCDRDFEQLPRIVRLLEDPSPGVRLQAVHALAPLGMQELEEALADRLGDDDRLIRVAAATSLAVSGDPRATPVLLEGVGHRRTRFDSLAALRFLAPVDRERRGAIEGAARRVFSGVLSNRFDKLEAAAVLAALGEGEGERYLLDRARRGKLDRPMAIELLGSLEIPGGEPMLLEIAGDPKDPFRGAALRGLGSYRSSEAFRICTSALGDEAEDPDVRCDAAEGLLLLGGEESRDALVSAKEGAGDERVRKVASVCLALFGKPPEELRLYLPLSGEEVVS